MLFDFETFTQVFKGMSLNSKKEFTACNHAGFHSDVNVYTVTVTVTPHAINFKVQP